MSMMSTSSPEKPVSYNVTLHCTSSGRCETHQLKEPNPPSTVSELKKQIEKHFDVPCCVQSVLFDGHTLQDDVSLQEMRIRHDDTFRVEYLEKAKCQEITNAIQWMTFVSEAISQDAISSVYKYIFDASRERLLETLTYDYFYPWSDSVTNVNKLHFLHIGGVEVLMKLLKLSLAYYWNNNVSHYTHCILVKLIWNFSETFQFRRAVIKHNGVSLCLQLLLRFKLNPSPYILECSLLSHSPNGAVQQDVIFSTLGLLFTLSELPECCIEIASNEEAMEQMSLISIQDSLYAQCAEFVAGTFLCVSFNPETHSLLCKSAILDRLNQSFHMDRIRQGDDEDTHQARVITIKYYTLLFMALVALVSPHCLPNTSLRGGVDSEIISFLSKNGYLALRRAEMQINYIWSTMLPYVKVLYIPNSSQGTLQSSSLKLLITSLQNMLGRENHRDILIKEGLLDYVTVAPQYVPASMKKQAKELVTMVRSSPEVPLGPPTLLNMVKAKLAKMHFGLELILTLSVSQIITKAIATF